MSVKPTIISIAAVSGGGKTTITQTLGLVLDDVKELFFDDYDFKDAPDDVIKWVNQGADYNLWNLEPMISDINKIKTSKEVPSYILLDYPFSYLNDNMKKYIDLSIYIDTSLDVAMARRILRDHTKSNINDVRNDVKFYLQYGRVAYLEMENSIKPNSDIVIDGTLPPDKIVELIIKEIRDRGL
jgi:uridine kinase